MPFQADTRCGFIRMSLNVNNLCEELQLMIASNADKEYIEYVEDINEGSDFWDYVIEMENYYEEYINGKQYPDSFWDFFREEYNQIPMWDKIKNNFKEV